MEKFLLVFKQLFFYFVLFLFAFIPLYPKFPLLNITGTFVAIRLEDILIALAFVWWFLILFLAKKWKNLLQEKIVLGMAIFFLVGIVSLFSGVFLTHSVSSNLGILHFLRRVEFMLLLPLCYTVVSNKRQLYLVLITLSVVVLLINVYALGQQYLRWPVVSTGNSEFAKGQILYLTPDARVNSTFAGHYDFAVFLVMFLTVISALVFRLRKFYLVLWSILLFGLSFVVLVMTAARLSFIAAVVGVVASLYLTGRKIFILAFLVIAFLALAYPSQLRDRFLDTITVNIFHQGERFQTPNANQISRSKLNIPTLHTSDVKGFTRDFDSSFSSESPSDITPGEPVDSTELGVYRSFQIRLNYEWPKALAAFYKNPLLGTGFSSLGIATDNDVLRLLGETGLLGAVSFGIILLGIFKRLWSNYRNSVGFIHYLFAGTLALILAFIINGLFIDVFESSKVASLFWMFLGVSLAAEKLNNA